MSHSKMTKRGRSLYVEKWNPSAKRFIKSCSVCGDVGYDPGIENSGFIHPSENKVDYEHRAIYTQLTSIYKPIYLDDLGRCSSCRAAMEKE